MQVTVLYFASLRETLGCAREELELPPRVTTAGELRSWLRDRGAEWHAALADSRAIRIAVDRRMAGPETPLAPGAEIAFFPPVTGG
ncbi:MAG TPA: molybdopterin converting factor subunit 1 [Burkholderiaceae bacterium]|nr:molybdopterin converting factor subunit 1 [Burkholderiaceae bacterium]